MAKKDETIFKEKVSAFLKTLPYCWFEKIQQVAKSGIPDFICCINGHFVAIELKRSSEEVPQKLQIYKLIKIAEAGGIGLVLDPNNFEETCAVLSDLANGLDVPLDQMLDIDDIN